MTPENLLLSAINSALLAGKRILEIYAGEFEVIKKENQTPVTIADTEADAIIRKNIAFTGLPIISEEFELQDFSLRKKFTKYWLVDPLDGTKEFVARNGEFTVNIALIENGSPEMGVIFAPVLGTIYFAAKDLGAWKIININLLDFSSFHDIMKTSIKLPILERAFSKTIVKSRSHWNPLTLEYIQKLEERTGSLQIKICGSSLKFCLLAEAKADIYPRFGPISEWDVAAGHAILKCTGGNLFNVQTREELLYNKTESMLCPYFIATSAGASKVW